MDQVTIYNDSSWKKWEENPTKIADWIENSHKSLARHKKKTPLYAKNAVHEELS